MAERHPFDPSSREFPSEHGPDSISMPISENDAIAEKAFEAKRNQDLIGAGADVLEAELKQRRERLDHLSGEELVAAKKKIKEIEKDLAGFEASWELAGDQAEYHGEQIPPPNKLH